MRTSLLLAFHIASTADGVSMEVGAEGSVRRTGVVRRHDDSALVEADCHDDPQFKDAKGYACSGWKGFQCLTAKSAYGYTQAHQEALLHACKESCKTCARGNDTAEFLLNAIESNELDYLASALSVAHGLGIVEEDRVLKMAAGLYAADRALDIALDIYSTGKVSWSNILEELGKAIRMAQDTGMTGDDPRLAQAIEAYTLATIAKDVAFDSVDTNRNGKITMPEWKHAIVRFQGGVHTSFNNVRGMINNGSIVNSTYTSVQRLFNGSSMSMLEDLTSDCHDNMNFKDLKGYSCSGWKGYECQTAESWYGYSSRGQQELVENCPKTCGSCPHQVAPAVQLIAAVESNSLSQLKTAISVAAQFGIIQEDHLLHAATALYAVDRGLETAMDLLNGNTVDVCEMKEELDKAVGMAQQTGAARDNVYLRNAVELYNVVGTLDKFAFNQVDVDKNGEITKEEFNNLLSSAKEAVIRKLKSLAGIPVSSVDTAALPVCKGNRTLWTTEHGLCTSYAAGEPNHDHCHEDSDADNGGLAEAVCPGCGKCKKA